MSAARTDRVARPCSRSTLSDKAWGLSPLDRSHRLNMAYTYELPFGKGRHWLGTRRAWPARRLDQVVGGWQIAGNWTYTSPARRSLLTGSTTSNINNTIKVNQTWGSYATGRSQPESGQLHGRQQVLYSPIDPVTDDLQFAVLDPTKVSARAFISGDLPPNDGHYRNPSVLPDGSLPDEELHSG